jgi:hypothetical protein
MSIETMQLIVTYLFDFVFYGFSTLFIFDFLLGLSTFVSTEEIETLPLPEPAAVENKSLPPVEKLKFQDVCVEFAKEGMMLERHRSGHYCYRVVFGCDGFPRFKRLQEALDWVNARVAAKSKPEESLLLVE